MFKLIELIKAMEQKIQNEKDHVPSSTYWMGRRDSYQDILDSEYPDWKDIYEFSQKSKQNTK